ncbi:MAG: response regulator [Chloroflexota bacterium]
MAHITVVNDNRDFLDLVEAILEDDRHEATTIDGDRADALDAILASRPDLLMIDLRMGSNEMHGWDVAKQVRATPDLDGLPILICSADIRALDAINADLMAKHRVARLVKPFGVDELTASVEALLAAAGAR